MIEFAFSFNLLSPVWWASYIVDFAQREPTHLAIECICGAIILYLIFSKPYKPEVASDKLSRKEEDELIEDWQPTPLVPVNFKTTKDQPILIVENNASAVAVIDGEDYLNLASTNFAGMVGREDINSECADVISHYGVGSCGPRGFYGTIDQHIEIEKTAAAFMGAEDAILYSDNLACVSSVIPAFAKNTDIIVVDEYCGVAVQLGCKLSRSTVYKYKHNDMEDLERILASIVANDKKSTNKKKSKLNRRFIITEGICAKTGIIADIKKIAELKFKYKFRTIIDDSLAIGVLGATGRGSFEHHGMTSKDLDIICFALDTTLAAVGGICVGSAQVVSHQRLSGAGYCFSAASPPYTARAATVALGLIDANPALCGTIRSKARYFRNALSKVPDFRVVGGVDSDSPVVIISLEDESIPLKQAHDLVTEISDNLRTQQHIITFPLQFIPSDNNNPRPSLRLNVTALHAEEDLDDVVNALVSTSSLVLKNMHQNQQVGDVQEEKSDSSLRHRM